MGMLILSRKIGESVMLGNNIEVVVLGQNGDRIKLGILAPQDVLVNRVDRRVRLFASPLPQLPHEAPLDEAPTTPATAADTTSRSLPAR